MLSKDSRDCDDCGAISSVVCNTQKEHFFYGEVKLSADVPVWECLLCGSMYTEEDAAKLRQREVDKLKCTKGFLSKIP